MDEVGIGIVDMSSDNLLGVGRVTPGSGFGTSMAVIGSDADAGTILMAGVPMGLDSSGNTNGAILSIGLAGYAAWLRPGTDGDSHVVGGDRWDQHALLSAAGGETLTIETRALGSARINATSAAAGSIRIVLLPAAVGDPEAVDSMSDAAV